MLISCVLALHDTLEKDACSHLCNHSGRSRGHMSPVSHSRPNLSFHSPSLHIKQHKWLNLHDRICNMANQVSAPIKHYTSAIIISRLMSVAAGVRSLDGSGRRVSPRCTAGGE